MNADKAPKSLAQPGAEKFLDFCVRLHGTKKWRDSVIERIGTEDGNGPRKDWAENDQTWLGASHVSGMD